MPVAILLFPTDEAGIVFITFLAAYFPIMVSTRHAVRALPTLWEDSVRTLGGGRWDVLTRVVLPGILPGVFGGLSVGMGVAWICVISAEMISGRLGSATAPGRPTPCWPTPRCSSASSPSACWDSRRRRRWNWSAGGRPVAAARRGEAAMTVKQAE